MCLLNWLRGLTAVEHSAPPSNDMADGAEPNLKRTAEKRRRYSLSDWRCKAGEDGEWKGT